MLLRLLFVVVVVVAVVVVVGLLVHTSISSANITDSNSVPDFAAFDMFWRNSKRRLPGGACENGFGLYKCSQRF